MRCILAAVGGAALIGLLQVLLDLGWAQEDALLRERLFVVGLNAIFVGWLAGPVAHFLGGRSASRAFWTASAATMAPWSWFAAGFALIAVVLAWTREFRLPARPLAAIGAVAHLIPLVAYFLVPMETSPAPLRTPPPLDDPVAEAPDLPPGTPDVLLIVCDTLRADAILDPEVPTPHLDRLRERGTWARAAVAPSNQTLPSHLSLLCGLDIEKVGMRGNLSRWPLHEDLVDQWGMIPIAELFRDAGWRTAGLASNPLLSMVDRAAGHQPFDQGFDAWFGMQRRRWWEGFMDWFQRTTVLGSVQSVLPGRVAGLPLGQAVSFPLQKLLNPTARKNLRQHFDEGRRTTEMARAWLGVLQQDPRPYFFLLHYMDPHTPYVPPEPFLSELVQGPKPAGYDDATGGQLEMRIAVRERQRAGEPREAWDEEIRYLEELYAAEVAAFDAQLGLVLEMVERRSNRPTVVLFTSDHGEAFGEHDNLEHAVTLFREEIDVPFVVAGFHGADVPAGRELPFEPDLVDAGATLLAAAGIPQPESVDGQDVLSPDYVPRPALAVMMGRVAVRDGQESWHGTLVYPGERDANVILERGTYELERTGFYDLKSDPGELRDLSGEAPEARMRRLAEIIRARLEDDHFPDIPSRSLSDRERAKLDALGYVGS